MLFPISFTIKKFLFYHLRVEILSVNIDVGVSEIIKSANQWIMRIQDKKVKKRANILLSAGLLVLMVKKLQNIFFDIVEEHLTYKKSWPLETK